MQIRTAGSVCVDASLVVGLLRGGPGSEAIARLWNDWDAAGAVLVAPTLLYYEVVNALHRYIAHGDLHQEDAAQMLDAALRLGISTYGDGDLHREALGVSGRLGLSAAYDGHYLALAQRLNAEFWTADRRLYLAAHDAMPWVHLVEG